MVASSPMASQASPTICHTQHPAGRLAGAFINGQDGTPPRPHPFLPLPGATLGPNSPMVWISITDVQEKRPALTTRFPGFPGSVGFCASLDCDQRPPFHRGILHPVGLGVGEWRFYQIPRVQH